jgi:hypothetical protein
LQSFSPGLARPRDYPGSTSEKNHQPRKGWINAFAVKHPPTYATANPERIAIIQPRVGPSPGLPWVNVRKRHQPCQVRSEPPPRNFICTRHIFDPGNPKRIAIIQPGVGPSLGLPWVNVRKKPPTLSGWIRTAARNFICARHIFDLGNPERIAIIQPRVDPSRGLPWVNVRKKPPTLTGLDKLRGLPAAFSPAKSASRSQRPADPVFTILTARTISGEIFGDNAATISRVSATLRLSECYWIPD